MITPFDNLKDSARIWIYQANRSLTPKEALKIEQKADSFISSWAAHGQDLLASMAIKYNYFLIIAADEDFNMASGCSIDSQFRFVQELGSELQIDFFNRMNIAFWMNDQVQLKPMNSLKSEVEKGNIKANSSFFDNNIHTKGMLKDNWVKQASDSWLSRYFKTQKDVI